MTGQFSGFILGIIVSILMESIYELESIISTLGDNDYFVDFLNTKSLEAGLIRLRRGQEDTQTTHPKDELYFVIEGEGYLRVDGKSHRIRRGSTIFVPSISKHNFYGNPEDLIVLYVLPKR